MSMALRSGPALVTLRSSTLTESVNIRLEIALSPGQSHAAGHETTAPLADFLFISLSLTKLRAIKPRKSLASKSLALKLELDCITCNVTASSLGGEYEPMLCERRRA